MKGPQEQTRVTCTKEELFCEACVQLKFLKNECANYDAGDLDYAKQIAAKLRVLLYDTKSSQSVLRQLERYFFFQRPDFIDLSTVHGDLPNKGKTNFVRASLCQFQLIHQPDSPLILTPKPLSVKENTRYPMRAFKTWWENLDVVLVDNRHFLSRKKVITVVTNTDGEAHVDPAIEQSLALLKRRQALPLQASVALPNGERRVYVAQIDQILSATIRTIASETLFLFEKKIIPYCQSCLKKTDDRGEELVL